LRGYISVTTTAAVNITFLHFYGQPNAGYRHQPKYAAGFICKVKFRLDCEYEHFCEMALKKYLLS